MAEMAAEVLLPKIVLGFNCVYLQQLSDLGILTSPHHPDSTPEIFEYHHVRLGRYYQGAGEQQG